MDFRNLLVVILMFLSLLGCNPRQMQSPKSSINLPGSYFQAGGTDLVPSTDKLSNDCLKNKDFDSCIYLKNPVAQQNAAVEVSALNDVRRFGIKIRSLTPTGFLTNAKFQILTLNSQRLPLKKVDALKAEFSVSESYLEQISAYYWANRAVEYLTGRIGAERFPLTPLKIYVDDAFTGYASTRNAIHLQKESATTPKALSGETVVHLLGEALAQDLSSRALFPGAAAQHKSCSLSPRGCCAADVGCAQALGSGFGDYVAAMLFPNSPRLGETIGNSNAGQNLCTMTRDLASLANRTRAEVYASCSQATGFATLMGAWYAAQWWKFRVQAEASQPGAAADIDKMFFDHARKWTSSSTFTDAKASALAVADQYKNGQYSALMRTAFAGF